MCMGPAAGACGSAGLRCNLGSTYSQMASQNPPRSYDDMILFALEQALREVWAVLKAHDPHGYLDKDQDLQKAIADKLMALADSGVTDPQELRRRTLENFDFKPPH